MTTIQAPVPVNEDSVLSVSEYLNRWGGSGEKFDRTIKVHILSNYTLNGVEPFLRYQLVNAKLNPEITYGLYNSAQQEVLDSGSKLHQVKPDIVVLSHLVEQMLPDFDRAFWSPDDLWAPFVKILDDLRERTGALVVVTSFPLPFANDTPRVDAKSRLSQRIQALNGLLDDYAQTHAAQIRVSDFNRFLRVVGRVEAYDPRFWYMSKAPFRPKFLNLFARDVARQARAIAGKAKKVLVLDCDNTLWGGVVGEERATLKLDPSEYPGVVFYEAQKRILDLYDRGVLLAIASKNNEQDVFEVMENHPHCLLKKEHFVATEINWGNKAENLGRIAQRLNLGIDSLVFVDDSQFECDLVRSFCPDVTTLTVPAKAHQYPELFETIDLYFAPTLTREDAQKTTMYRAEFARQELKGKAVNLEDYLLSLELAVDIHRMRQDEIPRVSQLTQKTNQFNLTTRRYTEPQVAAMMADPRFAVFVLYGKDRFGEMGLTNLLIIERTAPDEVAIDTYLMSCRVFERHIEYAFLRTCLETLHEEAPLRRVKATYVKSRKNDVASQFYEKFGFDLREDAGDTKAYDLQFATYVPIKTDYISVRLDSNGKT